jgi:hypothetical protein
VQTRRDEPDVVGFELEADDSPKLKRIIRIHVPKVLEKFGIKNRGYKSESQYGLGLKGEFANINRKTGKLYQGIWQGDPAAFESESCEEVLMDMIGHCLLALDYLDRGEKE